MIPLTSIQKSTDSFSNDPYFFLKFLRHNVVIEQGTTLSNVLLSVEPWKDVLTAMLDRNVGSYIDAIRKPSAPEATDIEWIGVYRSTVVNRVFERPNRSETGALAAILNEERKPTDRFRVETDCYASGFIEGKNDTYSISDNIHVIKNLPLMLMKSQDLTFYLRNEGEVFQETLSGVNTSNYASFVVGETSFSLSELMHAIFVQGLFFDTPEVAMENYDELRSIVASLPNNLDQIDEENLTTVSAEGKQDASSEGEDGDAPLKVTVVDGAFDSVLNHYEREEAIWKSLKEKCVSDNLSPIRIGEIAEAQPPENRIHGKVF